MADKGKEHGTPQYFHRLGDKKEGYALMQEGKKNFKNKHTFNENSTFYELYPYQITWEWNGVE